MNTQEVIIGWATPAFFVLIALELLVARWRGRRVYHVSDAIGSLSTEIRLILKRSRPPTLGAAARLPGVTPAALVALLKHVRREGEDRRAIA